MSCCGAQNLLLASARQILTAATPFASLHHPSGALGNVPTSISLHNYDALVCIIIMELDEMRLGEPCSTNPLRIPHPKIDKLACQA
ncbi:MAG: hypothetical protein E7607_02390 [Ruminococcaceae bacterium]|nr:hypothetical protein [Oscillospiraceae bacterium]